MLFPSQAGFSGTGPTHRLGRNEGSRESHECPQEMDLDYRKDIAKGSGEQNAPDRSLETVPARLGSVKPARTRSWSAVDRPRSSGNGPRHRAKPDRRYAHQPARPIQHGQTLGSKDMQLGIKRPEHLFRCF